MNQIKIEDKPFSQEKYFSGIYQEDNKSYAFTLTETLTFGVSKSRFVVWVDETPVKNELDLMVLNNKIVNYYLNR